MSRLRADRKLDLLRIRGAVLRPLRAVSGHPLRGAREPTLHILHGSPKAIPQHMKAGSMSVRSR